MKMRIPDGRLAVIYKRRGPESIAG